MDQGRPREPGRSDQSKRNKVARREANRSRSDGRQRFPPLKFTSNTTVDLRSVVAALPGPTPESGAAAAVPELSGADEAHAQPSG